MISIQPKWCELIASGKKTIEVRKTRPKIETPFKCYIYCTKAKEVVDIGKTFSWGKEVIGYFVCDSIVDGKAGAQEWEYIFENSNLSCKEIYDYCGEDEEGETKYCYGWHISDLVIYDKPRDVGEFYVEGDCDCLQCKKCYWFEKGNGYNLEDDCALAYKVMELHRSLKPITSPPKSWCYVEEQEERK